METKLLHFAAAVMETAMLVTVLICVDPTTVVVGSASSNPLLGVSPEDNKYYTLPSEFFKCKDGSKKIHVAQLNDDFCDCPDGSDEPGTSACPSGRFYCWNAGHAPVILFSSRVNDGICDCCDGSDEYDGKVKCLNTCWEAGKVARDKLKKKIATYQDGVSLRKKEIEQAKLAYAKDEAELLKLQNEEKILKGLVQELKERKEQIEKAEEKERLEKEDVEKMRKGAEEKAHQDNREDEAKTESVKAELVHETNDGSMGNIGDSSDQGAEELYEDSEAEHGDSSRIEESSTSTVKQPEKEVSENTEALSKEELGRLVASRWTGENSEKKTGKPGHLKDNEIPEEMQKGINNGEYDGYASEIDDVDADQRYDDHDSEDHLDDDFGEEDLEDSSSPYKSDSEDESFLSDLSNPSWLEKIKKTVRNILHSVNLFQTPVDKSDAARVRKEYEVSSAKLSKLQSRISSLSEKLKHDFGPEKEFYLFYDRCFESKQGKYIYKVCPFKQATQMEGHSTTRLGHWEKFEESYKVMLFSNGDRCWNGPDRSLKVKLRCGLGNEVADVDEPSRCEYVALFSTPNICLEEKLKELQYKLELMNKEQPQNHDEL